MNQGQPESAYQAGHEPPMRVIVTTGNDVGGRRVVEYLGVVRGIVVRAPNIGQMFLGGLKQLTGGNISQYAEVCEVARHEAYERMLRHAETIGANAVLAMRYDATEFVQGTTEVLCYGTAVRLAPQ